MDNCIFCDYYIEKTGQTTYTVYIEDYLREKQADRLFNIIKNIFKLEDAVDFYNVMTDNRFPMLYIEEHYDLRTLNSHCIKDKTLDLRKVIFSNKITTVIFSKFLNNTSAIEYIDMRGLDTSKLIQLSFSNFINLKEIYGIEDIDTGNLFYTR